MLLVRPGAHETRRAEEFIEAGGAGLLFLPSYPPNKEKQHAPDGMELYPGVSGLRPRCWGRQRHSDGAPHYYRLRGHAGAHTRWQQTVSGPSDGFRCDSGDNARLRDEPRDQRLGIAPSYVAGVSAL